MNHQDILSTAKATISQRGQEYGDVLPSFVRAANIAGNILNRKVTAFDVAVTLMAVKMSRLANQREHEDSWIDLCAYVAFAAQFAAPHTSDFQDVANATVEADLSEIARMFAAQSEQGKGEAA